MACPRILIACIGNIFLGDDGFGVEVAARLAGRAWPDGVRVVDFGARARDLAYALLDEHDAIVLVDATQRGGRPGTLYLIEPDPAEIAATEHDETTRGESHGLDPMRALRISRSMGARYNRLLLVGCEPETFGPEGEGRLGLSAPVEAALDEAASMIESLVEPLLREAPNTAAEFSA
ncbi:MAG: hydrogenase maturation protease [Blastocatellia bacterium]|nr:hydrogenase maturation protease [Blastocatellia bacterium]